MQSILTRPVLAVAAAVALVASPASAQSEGLAWRTDLEAAKAEARQSGKLVLAHFWTETCGPCKLLERRVFSQPQVAMAIANEYVPVKINANESPELAEAYGVTRVPTDAVLAADGQLVRAFVSPVTPMEYVGHVTQIASAYKSQSGSPYAAAVAASPSGGADPWAKPQPKQDSPFSSSPYSQFAAPQPQAATPQPQQPAQPPQSTTNRYAQAAPPVAPEQAQPPAQQVANNQPPKAQAPKLPPGSPPLGFEGFCPVTMKNEWRWAKGDVRFGAIHRGRTYLFTSAETQQAFLANPEAYSPALAGADPVAAVDERRRVPGVREYAVEYEGRFYLFSSEQTLEKFWTNPAGYAQGVERVASRPAGAPMIR